MFHRPLIRLAKKASLACGVSVQRAKNTLLEARRREFARNDINLVLDVGANEGQYVQLLRNAGYRRSIVSYEPIPEVFSQLVANRKGDSEWRGENCALAEVAGRTQFHVAANSVSSSLLEVTDVSTDAEGATSTTRCIDVEVRTLNMELNSSLKNRNIHLKLDTQGAELEVLRGASEVLPLIQSVECELSLRELYANQALFYEVSEFFYGAGFHAVWFEPGFQTNGQLLQMDALFVRKL